MTNKNEGCSQSRTEVDGKYSQKLVPVVNVEWQVLHTVKYYIKLQFTEYKQVGIYYNINESLLLDNTQHYYYYYTVFTHVELFT